MLKKVLILLGKPGYWTIIFLISTAEKIIKFYQEKIKSVKFKKIFSFLQKNTFLQLIKSFPILKKRKRGRPKSLKRRIILPLKKINRSLKKISRKLKRFFKRLKTLKLRKKKRGRPSKKKLILAVRRKRIALALTIIGAILIIIGIVLNLFHDLPSPDHLVERRPSLTTKIYDRNGILLYKIYRNQNRTLVPLDKIPQHLIDATLAVEDKEFYLHNGLSWRGILRALKHNLFYPDEPQMGGSTITQQLVKNALLTTEKTWRRKIREAILAILVELKFSKEEILQMYFNEVPYGGTAYGAEEATQKYFGKHVWETNKAETALIAGLTRAPTKYSPFGAHPENTKKRQKYVVREMEKASLITPQEAKEIIATPLRLAPQIESIKAPHFVFYVKDLLVENYNQQAVEQGGMEIITTLDYKIQQLAERVVSEELINLTQLQVKNGAALVINPKTGEILAMVGSKNYFDFQNDGNVNVTLRPRQPGSAIKPVNYSVALSMGYTAATIIPDTAITYQVPGQPPYSPRNYDNQFHGNVSLRTALASSLNVPAVKVLSSYGVTRMIEMGQKLGISTWEDPSRFGLSLTLGGGEVKMIDLAQAYSVLANLGKRIKINPIMRIKNHQGTTIYQNPCAGENHPCLSIPVLDQEIAFILNDILSDNYARSLAFGTNSLLQIPNYKVAVKTGTSNDLRDNWALGYTPSVLTAVWVGNNDNSPMSRVASGITGATPIWHKIMSQLIKDKPKEEWQKPEGVEKVTICQTTGTLPCDNCPRISQEYFIKGTQPTKYCQIEVTPTPAINF